MEVRVTRSERDVRGDREGLGEAEDVFEGRRENDCVGLPVEVFDCGPLRVRLGEAEEVLERRELAVCVFEAVMLRVAVAVEVSVADLRPVMVGTELLDDVFERMLLPVAAPVDRMDLVEVVLGDGSHVPAAERVDVVVFVEVLDCVGVAVGTRAKSRRCLSAPFHGEVATAPIDANKRSQRIVFYYSTILESLGGLNTA